MSGKLTLTGDKELYKKLSSLEAKIGKKIGRKALRAGAKIVAKEMKVNAPVGSGPGDHGNIAKAVKVKSGPRSRTRISVDAVIGSGDFKGDSFYAAMVNFGTSKQPPQAYVEKAFENVKDIALTIVEQELSRGIAAAAK